MSGRESLQCAILYFAEFERSRSFMMELRWPDGVVSCPACGATTVTWLAKQRIWKCYGKHSKPCFSLKTGTIFENSPIALEKWLLAVWMHLNSVGRISSGQLHRQLGVTQKTAWFMLQRIRLALFTSPTPGMLSDPDDPDETAGVRLRKLGGKGPRQAVHGPLTAMASRIHVPKTGK